MQSQNVVLERLIIYLTSSVHTNLVFTSLGLLSHSSGQRVQPCPFLFFGGRQTCLSEWRLTAETVAILNLGHLYPVQYFSFLNINKAVSTE